MHPFVTKKTVHGLTCGSILYMSGQCLEGAILVQYIEDCRANRSKCMIGMKYAITSFVHPPQISKVFSNALLWKQM